ncbi:MAG: VPA1262 family N-terminal domain-containing protein [Gallionella sp.]|nr:VPA1262 family N-terminal domain-containing protein [Gallionella sp.]
MHNSLPPFVDDFQSAVIRLATLQKRGEAGRLLFATVTLLSPDRPPPFPMAGVESQSIGKSGATVFFRRTILTAQAAVEWYRTLGNGDSKTPKPSRNEDIELDKDGVLTITVSNLIDDPIWPNLGFPMGETMLESRWARSNPAPFMGSRPARVHRRFGNADNFDSLLENDKALSFIARRLHINLRDYPEYLGSVALLVPDPIIRKVDGYLIPACDGRGERIFRRFVPRTGKTLNDLKITMFDEQANLLSNFETRDIPTDGILEVDKGSCVGAYGYVVTHPTHGVLLYHPPTVFLRQIGFSAHIVESQIKVNVPLRDSSKSPYTEYTATRSTLSTSSVIGGEPTTPNANVRVAIAASKRAKTASALHYDQRLFRPDSRREAMAFIHSKIGKARERVLIADPYFWGLQIGQYIYAVPNKTVKTMILTSRLPFEGGSEDNTLVDRGSQAPEQSKLVHFKEELNQLKQLGKITLDSRVLQGNPPVLHDRFLVVDNSVWLLGNSLNALGDKRLSMVIRLPNPDEILSELEEMFKKATPFDDYLKECTEAALKGKKK